MASSNAGWSLTAHSATLSLWHSCSSNTAVATSVLARTTSSTSSHSNFRSNDQSNCTSMLWRLILFFEGVFCGTSIEPHLPYSNPERDATELAEGAILVCQAMIGQVRPSFFDGYPVRNSRPNSCFEIHLLAPAGACSLLQSQSIPIIALSMYQCYVLLRNR